MGSWCCLVLHTINGLYWHIWSFHVWTLSKKLYHQPEGEWLCFPPWTPGNRISWWVQKSCCLIRQPKTLGIGLKCTMDVLLYTCSAKIGVTVNGGTYLEMEVDLLSLAVDHYFSVLVSHIDTSPSYSAVLLERVDSSKFSCCPHKG